jgi:hypothetical protein
MIPIVDFCSQNFKTVEILEGSIKELVDVTNKQDPQDPFVVVYNKHFPLSVLVINDRVDQLVKLLNLSLDDSVVRTGLLDLLRQGQVTVGENEPAGRVASLAIENDIEVVIAISNDAVPVGLFIPGTITECLPQTIGEIQGSSPQLQETIRQLTKVGDLPRAIMALEGEYNHYRSSRLASQDQKVYDCQDHGTSHPVFQASCSRHPDAPVVKRKS